MRLNMSNSDERIQFIKERLHILRLSLSLERDSIQFQILTAQTEEYRKELEFYGATNYLGDDPNASR